NNERVQAECMRSADEVWNDVAEKFPAKFVHRGKRGNKPAEYQLYLPDGSYLDIAFSLHPRRAWNIAKEKFPAVFGMRPSPVEGFKDDSASRRGGTATTSSTTSDRLERIAESGLKGAVGAGLLVALFVGVATIWRFLRRKQNRLRTASGTSLPIIDSSSRA